MRTITVFCTVRPGKEQELISLCTGMIAPSAAEQGCIRYSFYQDLGNPGRFFFYEEWTDQSAIDRHNLTGHFLAFQPKFKELIIGEPEITVRTAQ